MNKKYINRELSLRFMGFGGQMSGELLSRLEICEREVEKAAVPSYIYRVFTSDEASAFLGGDDVKKHLDGCRSVIVLGVTLGLEIDRYIRRLQLTDIASAMMADAVASAFIESFCEEIDGILAREFEGSYLTWRFSPGYGDYPIELQENVLRAIDGKRRLGLHLADSFMLIPSKSVTAVVGLSDAPIEKEKQNCAYCAARGTCAYRKEGDHCGR